MFFVSVTPLDFLKETLGQFPAFEEKLGHLLLCLWQQNKKIFFNPDPNHVGFLPKPNQNITTVLSHYKIKNVMLKHIHGLQKCANIFSAKWAVPRSKN